MKCVDNYKWEHGKKSSKHGDIIIDSLKCNNDSIYTYINSPVMGITHNFSHGKNVLFSIFDGTGNDILGAGISVYPYAKSSLDMRDLDMDGDIDFVMYGDQCFGRFKDNRFGLLLEHDIISMNNKRNVLEYLKATDSEQAVPSDGDKRPK